MAIMKEASVGVEADLFVKIMMECFRNPFQWGYVLISDGGNLDIMLGRESLAPNLLGDSTFLGWNA